MTDFEVDVLKEINNPGSVEGLSWGAGMGAALEFLRGSGYVTKGLSVKLTKKGREFLEVHQQ